MHTWHWQTWEGNNYLTCSLLDPWPHGFFTRQSWPMKPGELVSALNPTADVYRIKQVHGNQVLSSTEVQAYQNQWQQRLASPPLQQAAPSPFPEADGIYSDGHHQTVWVCSADCTPVLIADTQTGQVAAVHAGWRGTAAKIVPMAIAQFQMQGSRIEDLRVAMGPAIAGEVYQVTNEVAAKVGATVVEPAPLAHSPSMSDLETIPKTLSQFPDAPVLADETPGRFRLDVRRVNALQLEQLGLQPEQVAIAPHCTYQQPEQFFSYRRDGLKQVQWSGIMSISQPHQ